MGRSGCALAGLGLLGLFSAVPAQAAQVYRLDQRFGTIDFSVSNLGLFQTHGDFGQFVGVLRIDPTAPDATRIAVTVAAGSVHSGWAQETTMLRSAEFFDVARYPDIRFHSRQVRAEGIGHYLIRGDLTLRGRTRPVTLHARLVHEARTHAGQQIDDFVVTGAVSRHAFGMIADPLFIADTVRLTIRARVILADTSGG